MNAAARALHQGNVFQGDVSSLSLLKRNALVVTLWLLVIASALSVVYLRHLERDYYSQVQATQIKMNQAKMEHGQLLLEKTMWTSPKRIQAKAQSMLDMEQATPKAVIIIRQQATHQNDKVVLKPSLVNAMDKQVV